MTQQQLTGRVRWTVDSTPPEARAAGLLGSLANAAVTLATFGTGTGAPPSPTWELPADPDDYLGLGQVTVRGDAPWLPGAAGSRHRLLATQRAVLVEDTARRRPPVPVPLADLRIARARSRAVGRRQRRPDARWTLGLTGSGTVEVEGAWLALAWIGLLAGWPEPSTG